MACWTIFLAYSDMLVIKTLTLAGEFKNGFKQSETYKKFLVSKGMYSSLGIMPWAVFSKSNQSPVVVESWLNRTQSQLGTCQPDPNDH